MEFGDRAGRAGIALAVFAAAAALVYFGNGLAPRWALMWVAPLPVLLFALGRPVWQAGFIAAGAWLTGCLNLWTYFRDLGLAISWFLYFGIAALIFAAGVLLTRALIRHGAVWSAWLTLPAIWVGFEYLRNLLWAHGSAMCIAYSQLNFLPFLQMASLTGPWGMGFVLMLFPAGLALSIHLWHSVRRQAIAVLGSTLGIVGAVLIFGAARLAIPQPGPLVEVGLVASDINEEVAQPGAATERLFEEYAQPAQGLVTRGAQVVAAAGDPRRNHRSGCGEGGCDFSAHRGPDWSGGRGRYGACGGHGEGKRGPDLCARSRGAQLCQRTPAAAL